MYNCTQEQWVVAKGHFNTLVTEATGKCSQKVGHSNWFESISHSEIKSKQFKDIFDEKSKYFLSSQSNVWVGFRLVLGRLEVELEDELPSRLDPTLGVAVLWVTPEELLVVIEVEVAMEVVAVLHTLPAGEDEKVEGSGEATTVDTDVVGGAEGAALMAAAAAAALNILMVGVDCMSSIWRAALAEDKEEADCWRRFWLLPDSIIWEVFCEKGAREEDTAGDAPQGGSVDWESEEARRGLGMLPPFPSNLVIRTEGAWRARFAATDRLSGFSGKKVAGKVVGGSTLPSENSMGVARPEPVGVNDWERHDDWSTTSSVIVGVPSAETGVNMWEGMVGPFLSTGGLASDTEVSGVGGKMGVNGCVSASLPLLAAMGVLCEVGGVSEKKAERAKSMWHTRARSQSGGRSTHHSLLA